MSNFSRKEFEIYLRMFHEEWDRNALRAAFIEDNPDLFDEVANNTKREMAKAMLADGDSIAKVSRISGLSEDEIQAL